MPIGTKIFFIRPKHTAPMACRTKRSWCRTAIEAIETPRADVAGRVQDAGTPSKAARARVTVHVDRGADANSRDWTTDQSALGWATSTPVHGEEMPPCDRAATLALLKARGAR